ncbi:GNAT family protein [Bacillus spongiae]|uniref:GNAT family protein n=1 Tax=Bacillus spongiae TaxID=2683610 RepID=A0ABU8HGV7_9BACI
MFKIENVDLTALETDQLYLRILTLKDTTAVYTHFSNVSMMEYMDIQPCQNQKEAEDIIQFHIDDDGCRWGIFTKKQNELIGTCGFHCLRNTNNVRMAEVGFDLAPTYWGKGVMFQILQKIVHFGFLYIDLEVIDATVDQKNKRSQHLLNKVGFKREAELQEKLLYYSLNKEDIKR